MGLLQGAIDIDTNIFLFINGMHNTFFGYCNASFNDEAYRILQSSGEDEFDYESQTQEEEEDDAYYPLYQKQEGHTLNIQLTDDFNGKHLSEFKKALKNSHLPYR